MPRGKLFVVVLALFLVPVIGAAQEFEPQAVELTGTVRDFTRDHPDMQFRIAFDSGIVEPLIGEDRKPVYTTSRTSTITTNGREFFDQWYRDVEGVNLGTDLTIALQNSPSQPTVFTFDSSSFFPIDGQLFGNQGMSHNYYFTFEIHSQFTYRGGEVFSFRGDDDVFVFVNDHLVIDIGGVHGPISRSVSLDAVADQIGLELGETYPLDFFFAERFCCGSNFRMQTSIVLEQPPEDPCGNGVLDAGEQCDDGNTADGDGCSAVCELESLPPVALCQAPQLFTGFGTCSAAASVDAGSFDPEGDVLTLAQTPAGPYGPGATAVTLQATDKAGASATCDATVDVVDREAPLVSCNAPALLEGGGAPLTFTATSADNCQPPAAVTVEVADAACRNDDLDDDGVPDDQDECPGSDLSEELVIGECATGADNVLFVSGCTLSDLVGRCAEDASNHGDFVSCVAHLTNGWRREGVITGRDKGRIESCAARSPIPPGSTGGSLVAGPGASGEDPFGEPCAASASGDTVSFPEPPGIGLLSWTVTATDGFGNTVTEQCSVVLENPDTPLPNIEPVADAGQGGTVLRLALVELDGTGSADLDGDELAFQWRLEAPVGSAAALSDPAAASPSFVPDLAGVYRAELVVSDGQAESAPDAVEITALNSRPVADAGLDATAFVGEVASFDGSASADPDGDPLTFSWQLAFRPPGSSAELSATTGAATTLSADVRGTYVAHLVVSDGGLTSLVDAAILRVPNAPPVADAGEDQEISVFDTVQLDGSGSSDLEGDPLSFQWTLLSVPAGSAATLSDPTAVNPTFDADLAGTYVAQLVVSDGPDVSAPDTVEIVTINTPPVADAGPDQTAFLGDPVTLDGTGSSDVDGDPLTFQWTVASRPAGSSAALSDPTSPTPTFVGDGRGIYVFELTVHDGLRASRQPDRTTVTVVNRPPVADAGADQTVFLGDVVQLDGTGSFDLDGDPLTFSWSFVSRPSGSTAALSDAAAAAPTFSADARGSYVLRLVVSDGIDASDPDTVTVTVPNRTPVADAGPDQEAFVNGTVVLDGSASSDADGDPLTFAWSFDARPAGSAAVLDDPSAVQPSFVVDAPGTYVLSLVVDDGLEASAPDTVTVTTLNSPPVADAGPDQEVLPGDTVQLDGSGSFDVDGDPLTFVWSFVSVPVGSTATLSDPSAVSPTFVVDVEGAYLVELVVHDGIAASEPDTVSIATGNVAPVADAGPDQTAFVGDVVQLDGSGSFDANGDSLTQAWSFVRVPDGSLAALSDPTAVAPTFEVDLFGTYTAQLVVSDGELASDPDTVTITTENSRPVADAGADQVVLPGTTVFLDGSGSFDVDGHPLTFAWFLTTVPAGSTAALFDPTVAEPSFVADVVGTYVAQLIVNDGELDSLPDTVTIEASDDVTTVPDVVGLDRTSAETAIVSAGLVVGEVTEEASSTVPAGEVVSQDPSPGVTVLGGSAVDLVVSAGLDPTFLTEVLVLPESDTILVGGGLQLTAFAIFGDGTSSNVTTTAIWSSSDPAVAQVDATGFVVGADAGVATITAEVDGVEGATAVALEARVEDGVPPTAQLASPADNATVTAPVEVIGTATDTNFLKYELAISPAGDNTFTTLATGTTPVADGTLGTFDPTVLINGFYDLRLRSFDRSGFVIEDSVVVEVSGELKVGNFSLTFSDLEVPVAGIPITIHRTYDSRDKGLGDFGVGWRLEVQSADVEDNGVQGKDWRVDRADGIFPTFFLLPVRAHKVSVTLPSGRAEEFDFTPQPDSQQIAPIEFVTPVYTARPGTLGSLSVAPTDLFVVGAQPGEVELIDADTLEAYDPQVFTYTAVDGRVFVLDKKSGLRSVTDPNGNRLTIDATGVFHSSRVGVTFTRDAEGRITSLTDPSGNLQAYGYDSDGDLVAHTDREGNTSRFKYDLRHGLLEIEDPRGIAPVRYDYDAEGRLIAITNAEGERVELTHEIGARRETIQDGRGNLIIHDYDERGNVLQTTEFPQVDGVAQAAVTTFTYDADDRLLARTDPNGVTVAFTYDADGYLLTETVDPGGLNLETSFTYDPAGRVLTHTDARGNTTEFSYDAAGNKVSETDREGSTTTFDYDSRGLMTRRTDPLGGFTELTYDGAGNVLSEEEFSAGGVSLRRKAFTYDANGNRLSEILTGTVEGAAVSITTHFEYDLNNQTVAVVDDLGNRQTKEYDPAGRLIAEVDANGHRTEHEYDELGRRTATRHPDGTATLFGYDADGNRTSITNRNGTTALQEYDALNRVARTVFSDGSSKEIRYDAAGHVIAEIDEAGHRTDHEVDAAGRRVRTREPEVLDAETGLPSRPETRYEYDANGNRTAVVDARGHRTELRYDAEDRLVETIFPDLRSTSVAYDGLGREISRTDAAGLITSYEYDEVGRIVRTVLPSPNGGPRPETAFTYDLLDNLTSYTDALGRTTRFERDSLGRVVARELPGGQRETFTYDPVGNLVQHTNFNGATRSLTYDEANRAVEASFPDGSFRRLTYNGEGDPLTAADSRGLTTYTYDGRDRLEAVTDPGGRTLSYTYEDRGEVATVASPAGTTSYGYDALGRISSVTDSADATTTYEYDAVGNLVAISYPNGTSANHAYNDRDQLIELAQKLPDGTLFQAFAYTLDPNGLRTRVDELDGSSVVYVYDGNHRLTRETRTGADSYEVRYTYDAVGNRTAMDRNGVVTIFTYDDADRLLTAGSVSYDYDANGNRIAKTDPTGTTRYRYDFEDRLVEVVGPAGSSTTFAYDSFGNRVRRSDGLGTVEFLVDPRSVTGLPQVLEERDGAGFPLARYAYGLDLVSQRRSGATSLYHVDGLGSTRALTDALGAVTDTYLYDAYGLEVSSTGGTTNPYRFAGEQLDPGTGLYYLRARYYDPANGRFLGLDPVLGDPQSPPSLHRYLYAADNPINFTDPTGEFTIAGVSFGLQMNYHLQSVYAKSQLSFMLKTLKTAACIIEPGSILRNTGLNLISLGTPNAHLIYEYGNDMMIEGFEKIVEGPGSFRKLAEKAVVVETQFSRTYGNWAVNVSTTSAQVQKLFSFANLLDDWFETYLDLARNPERAPNCAEWSIVSSLGKTLLFFKFPKFNSVTFPRWGGASL